MLITIRGQGQALLVLTERAKDCLLITSPHSALPFRRSRINPYWLITIQSLEV
jgi:hypothetical protein